MELMDNTTWYLVRAGASFKETLKFLLPGVDVYQPVQNVKRYNRRLRKWIKSTQGVWPGYAFVRGLVDLGSLRITDEFHGLVRVAGDVVSIGHDQLEKIHFQLLEVLSSKDKNSDAPSEVVGNPVVVGETLTVTGLSLFEGLAGEVLSVQGNKVWLEVKNSVGNALRITVEREALST
jgi:hypothetical protein